MKKFKPSKRLRQGDPLAPFLFLIVTDNQGELTQRGEGREKRGWYLCVTICGWYPFSMQRFLPQCAHNQSNS